MRRILVVGSSGAGKSTLAGELARRLDLPLIHLDRHYWRPGWTAPDPAEFRAEVAALAARPAWVMDGNYGGTLDLRLPRADALVFCDPSRARCLTRVLRRRWLHRAASGAGRSGRTAGMQGRPTSDAAGSGRAASEAPTSRPDLPDGCPERIDLDLLRHVWRFPRHSRPRLLAAVAAYAPAIPVHRLRGPRDVARFLDRLA
ncbi:adenylate kinase [Micromonospora sediminicola]|uniref:adenylate kinase n=1 Tax=Micromonospora sediminicola TaxID=946078 RepID=UPI003799C855